MKTQLKTIRAGLEAATCYTMLGVDAHSVQIALTALAQLEAMVGEPVLIVQDGEICYKSKSDDQSYGMWCPVTPDADHGLSNSTKLYATQARADLEAEVQRLREALTSAAPVAQQQQYDQTALELCAVCGWKTLIPGDCCLNCERNKAQQPQAEAVWVNPDLEHMAEEAECVSMCLNDRGVPSKDGSKPLSLWGRVQQYANPRFLEGMTTNTPIISSEHIKALAQVCRLIGNYTTAEFVQNVVGFAQVLLANKAVQEEFVKANAHLLYAAPKVCKNAAMKQGNQP